MGYSVHERKGNKFNWTNVKPISTALSPFHRKEGLKKKEETKASKLQPTSDEGSWNREPTNLEKSQDSFVNSLKLEIRQLKALNIKLIEQKLDLEEKLNLEIRHKRFEDRLEHDNHTNKNKILNMSEKSNKSYMMSKMMIHVKELRKEHEKEVNDLKISFTEQVEELQSMISYLSYNLSLTHEK